MPIDSPEQQLVKILSLTRPWDKSWLSGKDTRSSLPAVSTSSDKSISESLHTSLLCRVREGENEASHVVVQLYTPMVYRLCRRSGVQEEDSEDIAQEVFGSVSRAMINFERQTPGSSFRGWIWTITRNKIRDHMRAKSKRTDAMGGSKIQRQIVEIPDIQCDNDETLTQPTEEDEQRLLHTVLDRIRDEFESTTWTAFWRATVKGKRREKSPTTSVCPNQQYARPNIVYCDVCGKR